MPTSQTGLIPFSATQSRRLRWETRPVDRLAPSVKRQMWALFQRHYDNVTFEQFIRDLEAKDHVILLHDPGQDGELAGFSTLEHYQRTVGGRRVAVVYSGDTIVAPRYWGQTALQRAFLGYIVRFKLRHPLTPCYWFLLSKGYKTYLLLSRNFPEHWPNCSHPTPGWERALIHALARDKFGGAWRPELGVLRFGRRQCRLKGDVAPIPPGLSASDAQVRFFSQMNPEHAQGDELCCVGKINLRQWLFYLGRLGLKALTVLR